jgi:hypothetical protein
MPPGSDPRGDIWIGVIRTDILLRSGGNADEVEAAGEPALAVATRSKIYSWHTILVRTNISEALTRAGLVERAAGWIDPVTEVPFDTDRWPLHIERANLDALRGHLEAAQHRLAALRDDSLSILYQADIEARAHLVNYAAQVDLWDARPAQALALTRSVLEDAVGTEAVALIGPTFVLAARAAADFVERDRPAGADPGGYFRDLMQLRSCAPVDPFTATSAADGPAHGAAWRAETARLSGQPSLQLWATAASKWDELSRPHDAAYCRWRGAQAALTNGHGTVALRLLRRATREARAHLPLSAAIAETAGHHGRHRNPGDHHQMAPRNNT